MFLALEKSFRELKLEVTLTNFSMVITRKSSSNGTEAPSALRGGTVIGRRKKIVCTGASEHLI